MSHIFIAHVEEDAEVALKIARSLEEACYKTWCYEIDSVPGPSYIVRTGESVAQSQAIIVIISPHSLGSSQVTKEVVRAHESDKPFIPILRDITHAEFQQRQPEWREAIGSATSIRIPQDGIDSVIPDIIEGARLLGIEPVARVDSKRISRISKALDDIHNLPALPESKLAQKPVEKVKKSRKPLFITIASVIVIAVIIAGIFLAQGGNKDQDHGLTYTTPPSTTSTSPSTTPATTSSETPGATLTPTTTPEATSTPALTPTPTPTPVLKPDLLIQDITWSPINPVMGDSVTFTVTITNVGKANAVSSHVAYYVDGAFKDTISVNPVNSGATLKTSFNWKAELGTHAIKVVSDFNDSVAESDETNNGKEINFSETLDIDLLITDITWSPANPSQYEDVVFYVVVLNQGKGKSTRNFRIYLYVDGGFIASSSIDGISTGESVTTIIKWGGTSTKGIHNIKFVTDSYEDILESDETNNLKTVTLTVQ